MESFNEFTNNFIQVLYSFGPKVLGAVLVFIIGLYVTNLIARMVSRGLKKRNIDKSLQSFLGSMVSVALKILLLVSVAGMLGIQTTSFVAVIGALGLAVGLALQGSLANFAGGVLILVFKPFKVGDLIESGGHVGHVLEIQIFNTVLLTSDNKTVILANAGVSNGTIVNLSRHGNIRVQITSAVALNNDINKVREIALDVMNNFEGVLKNPAPSLNVSKVGDGMVTLAVFPYSTVENYWSVFFGVQEKLKEGI
jgi:small conductance mechanosensitive channel